MYCIQPNYGGMLAAHVDEISAAQDEESRQEAHVHISEENRQLLIQQAEQS